MRDAASVQRCEACGIAGRNTTLLAIMRDSTLVGSWRLCLACAYDYELVIRRHRELEGLRGHAS